MVRLEENSTNTIKLPERGQALERAIGLMEKPPVALLKLGAERPVLDLTMMLCMQQGGPAEVIPPEKLASDTAKDINDRHDALLTSAKNQAQAKLDKQVADYERNSTFDTEFEGLKAFLKEKGAPVKAAPAVVKPKDDAKTNVVYTLDEQKALYNTLKDNLKTTAQKQAFIKEFAAKSRKPDEKDASAPSVLLSRLNESCPQMAYKMYLMMASGVQTEPINLADPKLLGETANPDTGKKSWGLDEYEIIQMLKVDFPKDANPNDAVKYLTREQIEAIVDWSDNLEKNDPDRYKAFVQNWRDNIRPSFGRTKETAGVDLAFKDLAKQAKDAQPVSTTKNNLTKTATLTTFRQYGDMEAQIYYLDRNKGVNCFRCHDTNSPFINRNTPYHKKVTTKTDRTFSEGYSVTVPVFKLTRPELKSP